MEEANDGVCKEEESLEASRCVIHVLVVSTSPDASPAPPTSPPASPVPPPPPTTPRRRPHPGTAPLSPPFAGHSSPPKSHFHSRLVRSTSAVPPNGSDVGHSPPPCHFRSNDEDEVLLDFNPSPERECSPVPEDGSPGEKAAPEILVIASPTDVREDHSGAEAQAFEDHDRWLLLRHASYRDAATHQHSGEGRTVRRRGWTTVTTQRSKEVSNATSNYCSAEGQAHQPDLLQLLWKKASGRCFNCFARDHRIAQCRDPPRCILRSGSGHKAKLCPSHPTSFARRPLHSNPTIAARLSQPQPQRLPHHQDPRHPHHQPLHPNPTIATHLSNTHFSRPLHPNPDLAARLCDTAWAPLCVKTEQVKPMEDLIPRASFRRAELIEACVPRLSEMARVERDLSMHSLVVIAADSRAPLGRRAVLEAANISFGLNPGDLEVDLISKSKFLLKFRIPALRNLVLTSHSPLMVGRNCLGIMPWTRQRWASTARMIYHVRVCIEGIPHHVWQVSTVAKLFDPATMIEGIDENQRRDEEESACFYLWVWSCNPDVLAKSDTLHIEEPLLPLSLRHIIRSWASTPTR
ncbi:hypothetical protein C2845_PM08G08550 [Panicum miliaceum]|uniref:DUF4283 domain-containing protein n=1 Tax=Panicum miliaceum TaxID=4540 RepID=A0A3L6R335_PANMI|nr:hypothetical protein C2845_PM08G08550 [Panicum miliaceum]